MDWVFEILSETTLTFWIFYVGLGFLIWYFFNGFEAWLNGGQMGRGRWWVFSCVFEEMLWYLPGGKMRIMRHLQQQMCVVHIKNGIVTREYNDLDYYEEEASHMTRFRNYCYFWGVTQFGSFFLWPLLLLCIILTIMVSNILDMIRVLWQPSPIERKNGRE